MKTDRAQTDLYRGRRSHEFSDAVNRELEDKGNYLPLEVDASSAEMIARAAELLSALEQQLIEDGDEASQKLTRAMALYFDSKTWHIVGKEAGIRFREKKTQQDFISRVAFMAAAVHEGRPYNWQDYQADEAKATTDQSVVEVQAPSVEYDPAPKGIHDTVIMLYERGRIDEGLAKGLLLVFEQVETDDLDPKAVAQVIGTTRAMVRAKLQHRTTQPGHPLLMRICGNERNGIVRRKFSELMEEHLSAHLGVGDQYLPLSKEDMDELARNRIAGELRDLYSP